MLFFQLRILTCTESDGPLCSSIAQATAPFLTTLEMALDGVFIPKFDFLISCVNLQVLKLSTEFHPPLKSYFDIDSSKNLRPETFLPKLEEVQLEFCMNSELEELFLKKPTLKHIDVLCLHHLGQTDQQFIELFLQVYSSRTFPSIHSSLMNFLSILVAFASQLQVQNASKIYC